MNLQGIYKAYTSLDPFTSEELYLTTQHKCLISQEDKKSPDRDARLSEKVMKMEEEKGRRNYANLGMPTFQKCM